MSSVLRSRPSPPDSRRQYAVYGYEGTTGHLHYFTVEDDKLYRIEADLSGVNYVIARNTGMQCAINSIDEAIVNLWETQNSWQNIRVVRPGIARKFQAMTIYRGNDENDVGDGNDAAYSSYNTAIYNTTGIGSPVNAMLTAGHATTTINTATTQNLPYGTFWAVTDPVVIEYECETEGVATYRRAIRNLIMETSLF